MDKTYGKYDKYQSYSTKSNSRNVSKAKLLSTSFVLLIDLLILTTSDAIVL